MTGLPFTMEAPALEPKPRRPIVLAAMPDENLSAHVRFLLHLTQAELAAAIGTTTQTISDIENGLTRPSARQATRLLGLLTAAQRRAWLRLP